MIVIVMEREIFKLGVVPTILFPVPWPLQVEFVKQFSFNIGSY